MPRSCHETRIVTISLIASAAACLLALSPAAANAQTASAPQAQLPVAAHHVHIASTMQIVILVKNESSHNLYWSGDRFGHVPAFRGPSPLEPGYNTYFVFEQPESQGALNVAPSWEVGRTGKFIHPVFSVPLVGFNGTLCEANEQDYDAPVRMSCSIGRGWRPSATLTVTNR